VRKIVKVARPDQVVVLLPGAGAAGGISESWTPTFNRWPASTVDGRAKQQIS
jgi:hypothetical protein